ncbi:MAG: hypothetical protein ACUZ8O_11705 [Candidatus Anammoxibacter sp.]
MEPWVAIMISDKFMATSNNVCEVARPLSNNLKGGYHINYPFRYVGRGRVCVVNYELFIYSSNQARRRLVDWVDL